MGKQSRDKWQKRNEAENGGVAVLTPRFGLEKACLFVIRWGIYLCLFAPLIVNTKFFFPFVAPKTIFFQILIEVIFAAYLFLLIKDRSYRPKINHLTLALILFLAVFILASFTGINLQRSFWSTNERMTGIFTMLHLFVFFIILGSVLRERKDWEKVLGVSVAVGVMLGLYVLMGNQLSTRGGGTIGNTSFMAAYLLFDIFFAIILFLTGRGGWQVFSGLSLAVMLPVLFTSSARGAIGSFFGGLFLLVLGFWAFSREKVWRRTALGVILVLLVAVAILAIFQPPFIKTAAGAFLSEMSSRLAVWETGWKGFLEKPILGWGPENFTVVFSSHFNPCMFSSCGGEVWFDRVHNIVLDTLVTSGLIGLLSYLAIFGVAIFGLLKLIPKITERRYVFFPLGLSVLLVVYFFQNLFVFDMISTYLVFFLTLAFIGFLTQPRAAEEKEAKTRRVNLVVGLLIIVAAIFLLWQGNVKPLAANYYLIKTLATPDLEESVDFFQKSLNSWMEKYEPREYFSQRMAKAAFQSVKEEDREVFGEALDLAEAEMVKSVEENPLDFRPHLFLGQLYTQSYRFSGDPEKAAEAENVLAKAIQLSPTNQQGYWNMAELKLAEGRIDETISYFKGAVDLDQAVGYSHWYLAMAYKIAGENQLAKEELILAEQSGYDWHKNIETLKETIRVYDGLGDDASLLPLYLEAIELSPNDASLWASLAAVYANLGQITKAKETAQKVIQIDPTFTSQVEKFLNEIPQQ
jgi:O-antigen ligase/tetratricopeptide (TPR) repeat protein